MKPQLQALLITITIIGAIILSIYFSSHKKDFTKVINGMTIDQVKCEVGDPDNIQDFIYGLKLLIYNDEYIIVVENGKVINKLTQQQFTQGMQPVIENFEKTKKGIEEWEVKKKEINKKVRDFQNSLN